MATLFSIRITETIAGINKRPSELSFIGTEIVYFNVNATSLTYYPPVCPHSVLSSSLPPLKSVSVD